jgi:dolichyl-diphosphooligosaccharide--protein glycosyltransferase
MRVLENMLLGSHFPNFINFDPYVNFPYGAYIKMAPLYDFVLAGFIWIISFGKPSLEIINNIAPFYPVFLGSLIPIVVYFIAKALWGNVKISLLSAFFISVFPVVLIRSGLGFNDHHIAEVLLSSLTMLFLIKAFKYARNGVGIKNLKLWIFIALSGISLGLYLLTWVGAILFLFIIFVILTTYFFIEFISNRSARWILLAGFMLFFIPLAMISPFFGHPNIYSGMYNINHILCFALGLLSFLLLWASSIFVVKRGLKNWQIIPLLVIIFSFFLIVLKLFFPVIFNNIIVLANGINNNGSSLTNFKSFVSEMSPLRFQGAVDRYYSLFFMYLIGFCIIVYNYFKEKKAEQLVLIIWTVIIILITGILPFFGQVRFDIYLSVNVALLSAFFVVKGFELSFKSLDISSHLRQEDYYFKNYFLISSIVMLFSLIFFLIYPFPFNAGQSFPKSLPSLVSSTMGATFNPYVFNSDWQNTLKWLKDKTPDPGLDFYGVYKEPGVNSKTGKVNAYEYPEKSYGILSHWDDGHAIEYYSQRPVIANNFQLGIGRKIDGKVVELGEAVFFIETDENKATSYLDKLRARYIVIDSKFAILEWGVFNGMVKLCQGDMAGYIDEPENMPTKYDNSMIARLHLLDGSKTIIEKKLDDKKINLEIDALNHFRLLYESETTSTIFPNQSLMKDIKMLKVFEYVKGAKIKGYAPNGSEINVSVEISTNQDRNFIYENKAVANNGEYEFIAPYATGNQASSDVVASDYKIKIGNITKKVKVLEDDILQGKIVNIK